MDCPSRVCSFAREAPPLTTSLSYSRVCCFAREAPRPTMTSSPRLLGTGRDRDMLPLCALSSPSSHHTSGVDRKILMQWPGTSFTGSALIDRSVEYPVCHEFASIDESLKFGQPCPASDLFSVTAFNLFRILKRSIMAQGRRIPSKPTAFWQCECRQLFLLVPSGRPRNFPRYFPNRRQHPHTHTHALTHTPSPCNLLSSSSDTRSALFKYPDSLRPDLIQI